MEKKLIRGVIPSFVTALVILLSLLLEQNNDSKVFRASIEIFLIFILPAFPIIYGYVTRDKVGSTLMGAMPFLGLFIVILFSASNSSGFMKWLTSAIPFWLVLITIAGLEGYFASKRGFFFLVAISLYILWILLFLSGIH